MIDWDIIEGLSEGPETTEDSYRDYLIYTELSDYYDAAAWRALDEADEGIDTSP